MFLSAHRLATWRKSALAVILLAICGLAATSAGALAGNSLAGPVTAIVERVVDGDTVRVRAQIWLEQELEVSVRLAGIDAPELFRPKCPAEKARARDAKAFVTSFLADGVVTLRNIERDKYGGRVVAEVANGEDADLAAALVANGLAVSAKRGDWCA